MDDAINQSRLEYDRGRDLFAAGDLSGAIAHFEASLALSPHFKTLEKLGEALLLSGEPVRAIVPLAAASTLNRQVHAPALLAEALLATGDRLKAYEIAKLVLERDPNNKKARAVFAATEAEYRAHNE